MSDPEVSLPNLAPCTCEKASRVMNNPVVLEKIAQWLPPEDLCTLRSTCTLWNQAMVPQLKEKHTPVNLDSLHSDMTNFTDLMRPSTEIPFTKFKFEEVYWDLDSVRASPQDFQDFVVVCGGSVKKLLFALDDVVQVHQIVFGEQTPELEQLVIRVPEHQHHRHQCRNQALRLRAPLPKLKRLEFFGRRRRILEYELLLVDIIQCAPSLQALRLERVGEELQPDFTPLLSSLSTSPDLKELKTTLLRSEEVQHLIECSRSANIQLKYLSTWVSPSNEACSRLLLDFLEIQGPTLHQLKLRTAHKILCPGRGRFRLPRMEQLRKLKLDIPGEFEFQSGFATCFPRLECLHYMERNTRWAPAGVLPVYHEGVKELHASSCPQKSFGVRSGVEALRHHLGELTASPTLESLRAIADQYKTHAGIRDLSQLQEFSLWAFTRVMLTDVGVYFGLALVGSHLQKVNINQGMATSSVLSVPASVFLRNVLGSWAEINL